jgi:Barstar (barnase inhibitor)
MNCSHLLAPAPPWLARYVSDDETMDRLILALRNDPRLQGVCVIALRGWKMKERSGVFDEFAAALQFPYYFGENWNAFIDCIGDLSWLQSAGFVLVVEHVSEVLVAGDSDEFGLFLERLQQAAEYVGKASSFRTPQPFHIILHDVPGKKTDWEARLNGHRLALTDFEHDLGVFP